MIKFISNFIQYIYSNNTLETKEINNNIDIGKKNYILFSLDKDSKTPNIKINIYNMSDEDCENYALLLYNILFGLYEESIWSLVRDAGRQDENIGAFTKNLAINYLFLLKETEKNNASDNKPLISPRQFNQHVN
jgi:hypothetical protein